jgi:hypothetical protein
MKLFRDRRQAAAACNALCASAGLEPAFAERGLTDAWARDDACDNGLTPLSNGQYAAFQFAYGLFQTFETAEDILVADLFELMAVPAATLRCAGELFVAASHGFGAVDAWLAAATATPPQVSQAP